MASLVPNEGVAMESVMSTECVGGSEMAAGSICVRVELIIVAPIVPPQRLRADYREHIFARHRGAKARL